MRALKRRPSAPKPARRSTAAARALKAARESEARFRSISELTPLPIVISSPESGEIYYANRAFGEMVGRASEELIGTRAKPLWADPEERARFIEALKRDGFVRGLEVRGLTVGGEPRHGLVMATPLEFDGHRAMLTCAIDVTELHRVKEERARADARLASLLEVSPDAILALDAQRRIVLFNRGAERHFGFRAPDILGESVGRLFPEHARSDLIARLDFFEATSGPDDVAKSLGECECQRGDGSVFPAKASVVRVKVEGEATITLMLRDSSERKATEAALVLAKEAAEAANKAKSQFLANMSHELRTPLNAILGFSEVMLRETHGPLANKKYKDYLGDIHASGKHLLHVINDVLDLAKIEAGSTALDEDNHRLGDLVREAVTQVKADAEKKEIVVSIEVADGLPLIRCDGRKIMQILLNLLSNAVKFTPSKGRIGVKAWAGRDGVIAQVSDTGMGMKLQDIPRAFLPFVQIDGGLQRRHGGTGLGLPLSRSLIEMHGGTLDLQSTPGEGTVATMRLPLGRVVSASSEKSAPNSSRDP